MCYCHKIKFDNVFAAELLFSCSSFGCSSFKEAADESWRRTRVAVALAFTRQDKRKEHARNFSDVRPCKN